jgi:hypothetical protein
MLYECKISSNKIVKRIEILIFKSFDIVYDYVKHMVRKWCDIIVTNRE